MCCTTYKHFKSLNILKIFCIVKRYLDNKNPEFLNIILFKIINYFVLNNCSKRLL